MDNYREVDLLSSKTVADSGTETIDINVDEPITAMYVDIGVTNDTAVADEVPAENIVSKIEIVDGGQVYWSTNGPEAVAVSVYESLRWPACWYDESLSASQNITIPLFFGRYVGDPQYAFSPNRLLNPQVKVTWAKNALHLTAGVTLRVSATTMQGVSAPGQALMTKNVRSLTSVASGIEGTDLPTDLDYRRLFVRAYKADSLFSSILTKYKLDCDVGKLIVFDLSQWHLIGLLENSFPMFSYTRNDRIDNGVNKQAWLGSLYHGSVSCITAGNIMGAWCTSANYYTGKAMSHAGAALTDVQSVVKLTGSLPHSTACYQFGLKDDPTSWFKSGKYGQVKLEVTQGEASADVGILLQQPRTLP